MEEGLQSSIYPLVASHGYFSSDFRERFLSQATRDMVSFCVIPTAIRFYDKIGGLVGCTVNDVYSGTSE